MNKKKAWYDTEIARVIDTDTGDGVILYRSNGATAPICMSGTDQCLGYWESRFEIFTWACDVCGFDPYRAEWCDQRTLEILTYDDLEQELYDELEELDMNYASRRKARRSISRDRYRNRKSAGRRTMRRVSTRRFANTPDVGFQSDILGFLADRLHDYEGETFYGCDMPSELTMSENMDGCWIMGRAKAFDYIAEHINVASEVFDNARFEYDMVLNPFDDPEGFTFFMLDFGVRNVLDCKFLDEHWDDEIELTPEVISIIEGEISESKAAGRRMRTSQWNGYMEPMVEPHGDYLTYGEALETIQQLSRSQGFYGRLLEAISEDPSKFQQWIEESRFADAVDMIMALEG